MDADSTYSTTTTNDAANLNVEEKLCLENDTIAVLDDDDAVEDDEDDDDRRKTVVHDNLLDDCYKVAEEEDSRHDEESLSTFAVETAEVHWTFARRDRTHPLHLSLSRVCPLQDYR